MKDLSGSKNALVRAILGGTVGDDLTPLKLSYANAMWAWAGVEAELFGVYIAAIGAYRLRFRPLQRSYFAIIAASSRLDVTHAAAQTAWEGTARFDEWTALGDRCRKELRTRGRIAHLEGRIIEPDKSHQKPMALLLEHSFHPDFPMKYGERKSKGFSAEQVEELADKWTTLSSDLREFVWPMFKASIDSRPEASDEQGARPSQASPSEVPPTRTKREVQPPPSQE